MLYQSRLAYYHISTIRAGAESDWPGFRYRATKGNKRVTVTDTRENKRYDYDFPSDMSASRIKSLIAGGFHHGVGIVRVTGRFPRYEVK